MKKNAALLLLSLALSVRALAADAAAVAHLDDPIFGFSVDLPSIGDPAGAPVIQRLLVMGPPVDGFAPNCNLQIQYTAMGLDAYLELTRQQFIAYGAKVASEKRTKTSGLPGAVIEYTANTGGRDLRHLALAVAASDRVWLLTCTSLNASFPQHRSTFGQIVESFTVKHGTSAKRK